MSLSRDDIGMINSLDVLHANFVETRTVEKQKTISQKQTESDSVNVQESEISDVYESRQIKFKEVSEKLGKLQYDYNSIEIKKEQMLKTADGLKKLKGFSTSEADFSDVDLEEIINNLQKNNKSNIVDNSKMKEIEQNLKSKENTVKAVDEIDKIIEDVAKKQKELVEEQQNISGQVNSLVKLDIKDDNTESYEAEPPEPPEVKNVKELKASVMEDIKENHKNSRKIQIRNLNKDMILAMMSLRIL